jgi:hypothetical protein
MPPTTISQDPTSTTTGNARSRHQRRLVNEGVASPPATVAPIHSHDTHYAASIRTRDASRYRYSQVPITAFAVLPGTPDSSYPVSIASIDADVRPPASSFCGTPIEMSPDDFSIYYH